MTEQPWLAIAKNELGVEEVPGPGDDPRVVEYLQSTSVGIPENENDETPWCSAFVNFCITQAGFQGTDSAWARSWLNWGQETDNPIPGDVVVLQRGASSGHVGFYMDYNPDTEMVQLLGGNQGDKVCYAWFSWDRVLGVRTL